MINPIEWATRREVSKLTTEDVGYIAGETVRIMKNNEGSLFDLQKLLVLCGEWDRRTQLLRRIAYLGYNSPIKDKSETLDTVMKWAFDEVEKR